MTTTLESTPAASTTPAPKGHTMPAIVSPDSLVPPTVEATPANDHTAPPQEHPIRTDLELSRVIVAAAEGDKVALEVLTPAIRSLARASLVYLDDAERVTRRVLFVLGTRSLAAPAPGRAAAFLDGVVRYYADREFDMTSEEEWNAFEDELLVAPIDPDP